ncbi:MAG: class I SAM-dependent RNA methyltransferase [Bacilli bacterium]|nr:class I SAM-dependent RNA methyltransferase [Bacilli bacterium]
MRIKIEKLDNFGRGICYVNNKICFVENALPNEEVEIEIIKENSKYIEANTKKIYVESPIRTEEDCIYSNLCGGCNLNHICYNEENKFKKEKLKDLIKKYAHINPDIIEKIEYHDRNHYRNKIILHGNKESLGLYKKNSNEIIPIQECLLVNPKINEIIKILQKEENEIEEALIKTSNDNSKIMVSIKGKVVNQKELENSCNVLKINNDFITKEQEIETTIGNIKYIESIHSFFQVNNTLTKELYDEVLNSIKDKHYKKALDLYCGTGTIGIYISHYVDRILGVDSNESNIKDANHNKVLNNIKNIEFIQSKVEDRINEFKDIDLIIVDPPRAGLDEKTRKYLKQISPKTIIYVSCDPVTLSRDLNELQEAYDIKKIKPFNMFPRTYHCESITILERR